MSRIPRSPPQKYDTNMQHTLSDSDVAKIAPCTSIQLPVAKRPRKQAKNNSDEEFAVFKDDIKCMLEDWKNTQNSLLNKLIHEVADIKDQNNQIKQSNEEIEKSLDFLNLQYEDIKLKVQGLETERKEYLQHITFLETKIEDMERNAKLSSIEIRNVPLINKAETKTDLCNIVQNTCKALNVIVPQVAIRDVYRLNKKNTKSSTIIADFTSVILKNEVIQGIKNYNNQHPGHRLSSAAIGFTEQDTPIYVSEALTGKGRRLFFLARDLAKTLNYKFCWTSKGRIFLRKTSDSSHIEVKDENQLALIRIEN
ncbi:hypothetical protein K1T71_012863 [Dendrolimus kikuchii]|uniref:Uncharacterized protein n=1 Tax=Dendrolimus kikuchii TaxID=765133 RepID=A0ACC1CIF6_9NEOP|nr:hypothetical protein K1T71_012863 [Dendrolimus kikuchii]